MAKMAKKKKKNYRLRKSVRRTIGALFMVSAIIVAAIPFPDAAATDGILAQDDTGSKLDAPYKYEAMVDKTDSTNDEYDTYIASNDLFPIDLSPNNGSPASSMSIRLTGDQKNYMLLKEFDFVRKTIDGKQLGIITKYYDTFAKEHLEVSSLLTTDFYTVKVDDYKAYFKGTGEGTVTKTLDLVNGTPEDIELFFSHFFPEDYSDYKTKYDNYKAQLQLDPDSNPTAPQPLVKKPADMTEARKEEYYCFQDGLKGYKLVSVVDQADIGGDSDKPQNSDSRVYVAKQISETNELPSGLTPYECGSFGTFVTNGIASIVGIGEGAFTGVDNVDKITLPVEIKYVANGAFKDSFIDRVILKGATIIGHRAFYGCDELVEVDLPYVQKIGAEAFYLCSRLSKISFADSVSLIGKGAFAECKILKDVDLSSITAANSKIDDGAFYNCDLQNLKFGSTNITTLGDGVFASLLPTFDNLTNVDMSQSMISSIGDKVFSGRSKLISVTMPGTFGSSGEQTLKKNTFVGCNMLGKVKFPQESGFVTYDPAIFSDVVNDTFFVEGPALNNFGKIALERKATWACYNRNGNPVPYVYKDTNNKEFYEVKVSEYLLGLEVNNKDMTATVVKCEFAEDAPDMGDDKGKLNLPQTVGPYKVIGLAPNCFDDKVKESFKEITIKDNSIQDIGDNVFKGCTNIQKLDIGDSVKTIGTSAFEGCTSLKSATIGSNVTEIKSNAFANCPNLVEIEFESPANGAASFPRENIGKNALTTGSNKLTVTGILEEGYGPFEWAMDPTNYVDPSLGIRVCYKTPSPHNMTVILDNQNNLPTLVDYPHYGDLADINIDVEEKPEPGVSRNSIDSQDTSSLSKKSVSLLSVYEAGGELTPSQEALVKATLDIVIPAGIKSIDVKGYLNDTSRTYSGVEPKTNGYNVSTYFTGLEHRDEYEDYGLFNGFTNDETANPTELKQVGNDRIRSVTMYTVKYLPNSDVEIEGDNLSKEKLAGGAFYSCENLETVILGSEMEDVGSLPFLGCYNLTSVGSTSPNYTCENKILYKTKPDGSLEVVQALGSRGNANDGSVNVANDPKLMEVTSFANGAFSDMPTLRRVDFTGNNLLTEIPDGCFYGDGKLSQVILPPNIRTIGRKSMAECADNVSLTIMGREVSLATDAFDGTEGAVVYAYKDTAAFNTADKIADLYHNVEVLPLDETFEVQFFDYDGITALTDVQYIPEGKDAEPPEEEPTRQGYLFTGWNKPYKGITESVDIIALYDIDPDSFGGSGDNGDNDNNGNNNNGNNNGNDNNNNGGNDNNGDNGNNGNNGNNVNGGIDLDGDGIPDVDENGNKLYKLTVTNGEGSGYYPAGKTVTIKAGNAPKGSTFAYWNCSNEDLIFEDATDWITTLTMITSDVTVIANYTGQYTLEVEYGSGSGSYPAGAKVAISAVGAPQGRKFASWVTKTNGLNIEDSKKESTVITMPAANAKVTATYMDTGSISGNANKPSQNNTSIIITKPGISDKDKASAYVSGSSDNFIVKISESLEATEEVQKALQKKYPDMTRIKYFAMDISLYDAKGENKITNTTGLKVNITIPIPDALREYAGNNKVGAVVNGELETLNPKFTTISGVPSITFTATHFSPYTIYVDTGNLTVGNTLDSTPKTGDGIHPKWFLSIGLACISIILFTKRDRRYTKKAYR